MSGEGAASAAPALDTRTDVTLENLGQFLQQVARMAPSLPPVQVSAFAIRQHRHDGRWFAGDSGSLTSVCVAMSPVSAGGVREHHLYGAGAGEGGGDPNHWHRTFGGAEPASNPHPRCSAGWCPCCLSRARHTAVSLVLGSSLLLYIIFFNCGRAARECWHRDR